MFRALGLVCALAWTPGFAWAAAAAEGGSNLFAGDLGNMIWTLVIFLAVIFTLGKFAWGPLLESLQGREQFIRESLESAKRDRDDAAEKLAELEQRLNDARAEATAIVDEGRRDAEVVKAKIEEEARAEAAKTLERAKREIQLAKAGAIKELYATGANIATSLAEKVIRREVSSADHERLIAEAITDLSSEDLN